jgi:hypothetical protein
MIIENGTAMIIPKIMGINGLVLIDQVNSGIGNHSHNTALIITINIEMKQICRSQKHRFQAFSPQRSLRLMGCVLRILVILKITIKIFMLRKFNKAIYTVFSPDFSGKRLELNLQI